MSDLKQKFGRNVKKYRLMKGMTQEELADKATISIDFLSLIERGKNAPSFRNIEKIAVALEVELFNLFKE